MRLRAMARNFLSCDREQELLLPPSLREWLPQDHLVWCVLDAVEEMDLDALYGDYRTDGWGRAAHDPAMMVALLLYAYAIGERSSRRIERRCREDVAFRVICANRVPDHATIARSSSPAEKAPSKRDEIRPWRSMTNVHGSDCRCHAATCGRTPLLIWLLL